MNPLLLGAFLLLAPLAALAYVQRREDAAVLDALPVDTGADYPATLDEPSFLESISLAVGKQTRGERNNNPGNIRISAAAWHGKVQGSDTAFEAFATPEQGIRALAVLLKGYQKNYGLKTIRQILTRYAPASENNTNAYVAAVAADTGIPADQAIDLNQPDTLGRLVAAIIRHENGRNVYTSAQIATGVMSA